MIDNELHDAVCTTTIVQLQFTYLSIYVHCDIKNKLIKSKNIGVWDSSATHISKVGCVFPDDEHREDAPHFIIWKQSFRIRWFLLHRFANWLCNINRFRIDQTCGTLHRYVNVCVAFVSHAQYANYMIYFLCPGRLLGSYEITVVVVFIRLIEVVILKITKLTRLVLLLLILRILVEKGSFKCICWILVLLIAITLYHTQDS